MCNSKLNLILDRLVFSWVFLTVLYLGAVNLGGF
jgi:hypothetical protein